MSAERPERRDLDGSGLRVAIVCSRFNGEITESLLAAATRTLVELGVREGDIVCELVPGAFELPVVAQRFAASGSVDAVIALGAVIRGETSHYELVATAAASGIARVALDTGVPVIFGVLATETPEQARARSGGALGNHGEDAAVAAVDMATLMRRVAGGRPTGVR
ncbi:MAG: 6,7-dimethyl-8-ribityllumazine synthase [Actinomycetota bacterium]|nr:6,7-dimethyl-8-ribityllumazine synthase [Actinomycetota bacterium]